MALHPLKLPKSAPLLFRVVVLQKRLLKELADPALESTQVNTSWVQEVWSMLDKEWVRKFCLAGQEARIKVIAASSPVARNALFQEFSKQSKVKNLLDAGGDFQALTNLQDVDIALAKEVKKLFKYFYTKLSHITKPDWPGYNFGTNRIIRNRGYKDDFCSSYPTSVVCPYCDGEIGTPELDHYLPKNKFPLLSCSPWNLVPVCGSCNDVITAKGERAPYTLESSRPTDEWLHPYFRPASNDVQIKLSGSPKASIPELHSPDPLEQTQLRNHSNMIQTLSKRWTNSAASYHDKLVRDVKRAQKSGKLIDEIVDDQLFTHEEDRGKSASSMIKAAVCQAILDNKPGYREEIADPNEVSLV